METLIFFLCMQMRPQAVTRMSRSCQGYWNPAARHRAVARRCRTRPGISWRRYRSTPGSIGWPTEHFPESHVFLDWAEQMMREILKRADDLPFDFERDRLRFRNSLGITLLRQSKFEPALEAFQVAWEGRTKLLSGRHPETLESELVLA
jgi:hypothetical protein